MAPRAPRSVSRPRPKPRPAAARPPTRQQVVRAVNTLNRAHPDNMDN